MTLSLNRLPISMSIGGGEPFVIGSVEITGDLRKEKDSIIFDVHKPDLAKALREAADRLDPEGGIGVLHIKPSDTLLVTNLSSPSGYDGIQHILTELKERTGAQQVIAFQDTAEFARAAQGSPAVLATYYLVGDQSGGVSLRCRYCTGDQPAIAYYGNSHVVAHYGTSRPEGDVPTVTTIAALLDYTVAHTSVAHPAPAAKG